jgi:hypothetical protein
MPLARVLPPSPSLLLARVGLLYGRASFVPGFVSIIDIVVVIVIVG